MSGEEKSSSVELRELTKSDSKENFELLQKSIMLCEKATRKYSKYKVNDNYLLDEDTGIDDFIEWINKCIDCGQRHLLIYHNDKIIGAMVIATSSNYNKECYLLRFSIFEEFQRNGFGEAALVELFKWSSNNEYDVLSLGTNLDNKESRSLYEKHMSSEIVYYSKSLSDISTEDKI